MATRDHIAEEKPQSSHRTIKLVKTTVLCLSWHRNAYVIREEEISHLKAIAPGCRLN